MNTDEKTPPSNQCSTAGLAARGCTACMWMSVGTGVIALLIIALLGL